MFLGLLIFWIFPRELLMIFSATPEMLEIGIPALRTISLCFVPAALGIMVSTFFQGVGNGKYSLYISMLRQVVIVLPVAYLFSKIGLSWVWWAYPIAEGFPSSPACCSSSSCIGRKSPIFRRKRPYAPGNVHC